MKELKQKAQQAAVSAEQSEAEREAAKQETTKLEALAAELKEQLRKAGSDQVLLSLGLAADTATLQHVMRPGSVTLPERDHTADVDH